MVATVARPLPAPQRPRPGWSEQSASYADVALEVLRVLAGQLGGRPVAGLAVTSTSGTVVPCDARGVPEGDALLYDDRRAAEDRSLLARAESAHRDAAQAPDDLSTDELPAALGRIAWLERHRPAPRYLHVADVVVAVLDGPRQVGVAGSWPRHRRTVGAAGALGHRRLDVHRLLPVDPVTIPDQQRDRSTGRVPAPDARKNLGAIAFDLHPAAAAVPGLPPAQFVGDRLEVDGEAGRHAFEDGDERLAM